MSYFTSVTANNFIYAIQELVEQDKKLLILIRGLPGTGKSTIARAISKHFYGSSGSSSAELDYYISEADSYFLTGSEESGNLIYAFDVDRLPKAHQLSFEKVCKNIRNELSVVLTSNTFTQYWEMYNYIEAAKNSKYSIFVIDTASSLTDAELERRNVHGVDKSKISAMRKRFQESKVGLWSDQDVIDFLVDNNRSVIQSGFLGLYVNLAAILDSAVVVVPLLTQLNIAELITATNNLRKRNAVRKHIGDNTYHLTILPAATTAQVSEEQRRQLFQVIYHSVVVKVDGCGYIKDAESGNMAIYLTVDDSGVQPIRSWMRTCGLNAEDWSPHITIGFCGSDIHDVRKPKMFSFPSNDTVVSQDEIDLCRCLLHPSVKIKAKTSSHGIDFVDISVLSVPGMGDDLTYSKNPELLALVPRGLVYAHINRSPSSSSSPSSSTSNESAQWVCALRGITKFTGTVGNDDDVDLVDAEAAALLTNLCGRATHFRTSSKENGRSGGFSVVCPLQAHPETYLVCVGTKLSHLLVNYNLTSNSFDVDPAWLVDANMRMLIRNIEAYQDLFSNCQRELLFSRLCNSPPPVTLNCEVLDHEDQHIERLPDGCLTAVCLNIVGSDGRYDPTLLNELQSLGLRTVTVGAVKPIEEFAQEVRKMKAGRKEGYVVQFLDSSGAITSLLKVKCLWYIVVRAIREVTKSKLLSGRNALKEHAQDIESKMSMLEGHLKELGEGEGGRGRRTEQRDGYLKQHTALKGALDKVSQQRKAWYTTIADKAYESIKSSWKTKFDFIRADVDDFTAEKTERVIELAGSFMHWLARKLDEKNSCGDGDSSGGGDSRSSSGKHGEEDGKKQMKDCSKVDFTSTFPIIWDEFIADGFDESFLLLNELS